MMKINFTIKHFGIFVCRIACVILLLLLLDTIRHYSLIASDIIYFIAFNCWWYCFCRSVYTYYCDVKDKHLYFPTINVYEVIIIGSLLYTIFVNIRG
jgi:hypothetical protein